MRETDFETAIKVSRALQYLYFHGNHDLRQLFVCVVNDQIVIVGNGIVGKSSMIQRYCQDIFTNDYKKTIGVDILDQIVKYVCLLFSFSTCYRIIIILLNQIPKSNSSVKWIIALGLNTTPVKMSSNHFQLCLN